MARLLKRKRGISFVAPSGQVLDTQELDRAVGYFESRGYRVFCPQAVRRSHQRSWPFSSFASRRRKHDPMNTAAPDTPGGAQDTAAETGAPVALPGKGLSAAVAVLP